MVGILRRRGMMVEAGSGPSPTPEWDYEWDYTKGLLNSDGWTRTTSSGSPSATITSDYLDLYGSSTNYYNFTYPESCTIGVMEAEIYSANNAQIQIRFGNGEYGVGVRLQTSSNYKGIYLGSALTTKIVSASTDTKYKIKMVLKGTTADIYVNDVLRLEDEDVTSLTTCADILVSGRASSTTNRHTRLYSLKMKFNRIS